MKILLTGATGFVGRMIATHLQAQGHQLLPCSRQHGFDFARLETVADWLPLLQQEKVEAVINAAGILCETRQQRFRQIHTTAPQALFTACVQAGVKRVIQISALGSAPAAPFPFLRSKGEADAFLMAQSLEWFVLRPSLVYGPGGKSADLCLRLARLPLLPMIAGGQQPVQPVHISDVLATVSRCLDSPHPRQVLDILGPEALTFVQWLQQMRQAQGLPPVRPLPLPAGLLACVLSLARPFSPLLHPDNLHMLLTAAPADPAPLFNFLGRQTAAACDALFFSTQPLHGATS
jgi:uncharacterized protein YbjT (DUF2867 family)